MEKTDAMVAGGGALILVVAIAVAGVTGGGAQTFDLVVTTKATPLAGGSRDHTTDATIRDSFTIMVDARNATRLDVTASVSFLAGPGAQASMRALLRAPNGTAYEHEGRTAAPPVGGTQGVASAVFDIPLGPAPANATLVGTSDDAVRAAAALATSEGLGNWTLELSFSAGLTPVPATSSWKGTVNAYHVEPRLAIPEAR